MKVMFCIKCNLDEVKTHGEICNNCRFKESRARKKSKSVKKKNKRLNKNRVKLREHLLNVFPPICMKCGARNRIVQVDHIKPVSVYRHLEYDLDNCQILCSSCNYKKGNKVVRDYRSENEKTKIKEYIKTLTYSDKIVKIYLVSQNKFKPKIKKELVESGELKRKTILRKKAASPWT